MDFILADFFQGLRQMIPALFAPYLNLIGLQERLWAFPELDGYFSSDRWKNHPINS